MLFLLIAVFAFVAWVVAFVVFRVVGVAIHVLLAIAIIVLLLGLAARHGHGRFGRHVSGERAVPGARSALVIPV